MEYLAQNKPLPTFGGNPMLIRHYFNLWMISSEFREKLLILYGVFRHFEALFGLPERVTHTPIERIFWIRQSLQLSWISFPFYYQANKRKRERKRKRKRKSPVDLSLTVSQESYV